MTYQYLDNTPSTTKTLKDGIDTINSINQGLHSVDSSGTPLTSNRNKVLATGNGVDAEATYRALVLADIPATALNTDNHTDGSINKVFTGTEKTKLAGIATGATNNSSDAVLLNTDNHIDGTTNKVFTAVEKTKLAGISGTNTGDQNIFSNIAVDGQSNVIADTTSDKLTLAAGAGIAITTDATTDTITIANTISSDSQLVTILKQNYGVTGIVCSINASNSYTTSGSMTTSQVGLMPIYIGSNINTLTNVYFVQTVAGTWTPANTNGILVYGVNGSENITLLGTLGSYTTFSTSTGLITVTTSIDVSSYDWLYVGAMFNGSSVTTPPNFIKTSSPLLKYSNRPFKFVNGVTSGAGLDGTSVTANAVDSSIPLMWVRGTA